MLKSRIHRIAAFSIVMTLSWMVAAPAVARAQTSELTLGNYDDTTKIYTNTDGGFQVSFPEQPREEVHEKDSKNIAPGVADYNFGVEKVVGQFGEEGAIAVGFTQSARLEQANASEHRKLADAFFDSIRGRDNSGETVRRRELKVPGAAFAAEYVLTTPLDEETLKGPTESRVRILFSGKTWYTIIVVANEELLKRPEIAKFADSFKLLNAPDSKKTDMPTVDTTPEIEGVATFTSKEDQFRVDFPGIPELEVTTKEDGEIIREWQLFSQESVIYGVVVHSVELQGEALDRFLGLFRINEIIRSGESKDLRADEKLVLADGTKAIEIEMPVKGNLRDVASLRTRFFVTNGRFYILRVSGTFSDVRGEQANQFFNSFEVLGAASSPVPEDSPEPIGAPSLRDITSVEDGFSIKLPTEPKREVSESKDESGKPFSQIQYSLETATGAYLVTLQESTGIFTTNAELREAAFSSTRDRLSASFQSTDVKEEDIRIGKKFPAKEFRFRLPDSRGEYRTQIFFTESNLFQIIAVGTVDFANSKQTDDVFKSFRLIDEASKSSPETALIEYSSALGGFNARLPSKPVYSRRTEKDANGIGHIQHRYLCETEDNAVLVSVTEFDGLCHNSDSQLSTMCESFVRGMAGKNKVEQFARVQSDVNAHEWTFRHTMPEPGVKVQGRVVIANDRFYIVQVIGDAAYLSDSSTNDVVQSLGVVTEVSKE